MSQIQRGDMVGLFYEYGPESCIYLGLAEYIGPEEPPEGLALRRSVQRPTRQAGLHHQWP